MRAALIYLVVGSLWILLSDRVVELLVPGNGPRLSLLQTYKGWFFVSVSSVLLYVLVSRALSAMHAAQRELQAAKEAAEAASGAKDRFLAVLSHELRTPLTPVLAAVTALECDQRLDDALRQEIGLVRRNVELEARLIDDLLDLTRIASGKVHLRLEAVDAHQLLVSALDIARNEIQAKDLRVATLFHAYRHHVSADPARLLQVFWNLVQNAAKFTPAGGQIMVRTSTVMGTLPLLRKVAGDDSESLPTAPAPTEVLRIEVIDTGIGIDNETLPRIFRAFDQGGRDVARQFGGLGLGLAISRSIIQLHGGTISASSEGRERGATFTVELETVCATPISPAQPPVPQQPASRPKGLRILLVEDNADTARILSRLLRSLKHEVTVADRVESAIQAADVGAFDLLISDIGLPDGSGVDLMRRLRARRPIHGIAVSGFGMEEDVRRSLAAGFAEHLTKPVSFDQLEAAIARAAERQGAGMTSR